MLTQERQEIVKDLVHLGQERGYVSLDQVMEHAPSDLEDHDLSAIMQDLESQGSRSTMATRSRDHAPSKVRLRNRSRCMRRIRGRISSARISAR